MFCRSAFRFKEIVCNLCKTFRTIQIFLEQIGDNVIKSLMLSSIYIYCYPQKDCFSKEK